MKSLLIGRTAWLLALLCWAAELGAKIPVDIAGSGTGVYTMVGSIVLFAVAYRLRSLSLRLSYVLGLGACSLGAATMSAIAIQWFDGGAQACSCFFTGGVLAISWTGMWEFLRAPGRLPRQRSIALVLCYFNVVLSLLNGWYLHFSSALMVCLAVGCFHLWATEFVKGWRMTRGNDTTWRKALGLATRLYIAPIDAYRESLRHTAG